MGNDGELARALEALDRNLRDEDRSRQLVPLLALLLAEPGRTASESSEDLSRRLAAEIEEAYPGTLRRIHAGLGDLIKP